MTAYDRQTHALILNMDRASRSSQIPDLQKNPDGSVDIYFGPKAPAGKASNWVPTDASRNFELMFRVYGPEKPFHDKTWKLPGIEALVATRHARYWSRRKLTRQRGQNLRQGRRIVPETQ